MGAVESSAGPDARRLIRPGRIVLLATTALSFYIFAPDITEVFKAADRIGDIPAEAIAVVLVCELGSFACTWALQAITMRSRDWFSIITTELAANAFRRIVPGGGAVGTAIQVRLLRDAGFDVPETAAALTVQSVLITAAVVAMPVLCLPAIVFGGTDVPDDLAAGAWTCAVVFAVLMGIGATLLRSRRFAIRLGGEIERLSRWFRRKHPPVEGIGERLLEERDEIRRTLASDWLRAVSTAIGRWAFEYLVLLVTLDAIGANPDPWLVLIVFVAASALGMLPFTPGGLGFVEAGLVGALTLTGVHTGDAVLATLMFRLMSLWLPLPIGAVAGLVFRRRHPHRSLAAPVS